MRLRRKRLFPTDDTDRFTEWMDDSNVAQYHQDTFIYIRKAVRADLRQNEYLSLDMKNIQNNIKDFKKEVLRAFEINYMVEGDQTFVH